MEKREKEDRLLKSLMADFTEGDMQAAFFPLEETGGVTDILRVAVENFGRNGDAILGEFFFLPLENGASDVLYFASVLSLDEVLEPVHLPQLYNAISRLNYYLPAGCFAVNASGTMLVFKVMAQLPGELSEEAMLRQMNIAAVHALQVAEPYTALLIGIAHGDNDLSELAALLPDEDAG